MRVYKKMYIRVTGKATSLTLGGISLPVDCYLATEMEVKNLLLEGAKVEGLQDDMKTSTGEITLNNVDTKFGDSKYLVFEPIPESKSLSYKEIPLSFVVFDKNGVRTPVAGSDGAMTLSVSPSELAEIDSGKLKYKKAGQVLIKAKHTDTDEIETAYIIKPAFELKLEKEKLELELGKTEEVYYEFTGVGLEADEFEIEGATADITVKHLVPVKALKISGLKAGNATIKLKVKGTDLAAELAVTVKGAAEKIKEYKLKNLVSSQAAHNQTKVGLKIDVTAKVEVSDDLAKDNAKLQTVKASIAKGDAVTVEGTELVGVTGTTAEFKVEVKAVKSGEYQLSLKSTEAEVLGEIKTKKFNLTAD